MLDGSKLAESSASVSVFSASWDITNVSRFFDADDTYSIIVGRISVLIYNDLNLQCEPMQAIYNIV